VCFWGGASLPCCNGACSFADTGEGTGRLLPSVQKPAAQGGAACLQVRDNLRKLTLEAQAEATRDGQKAAQLRESSKVCGCVGVWVCVKGGG
jgi:hypothetical protein